MSENYAPNSPMPKKILVALPKALLDEVDVVARMEHRTRSELLREMARRYLHVFRKENNLTAIPIDVEPITSA